MPDLAPAPEPGLELEDFLAHTQQLEVVQAPELVLKPGPPLGLELVPAENGSQLYHLIQSQLRSENEFRHQLIGKPPNSGKLRNQLGHQPWSLDQTPPRPQGNGTALGSPPARLWEHSKHSWQLSSGAPSGAGASTRACGRMSPGD